MSKKIYVFLAEGFEEVEALAPLDIFYRCGFEAITVSTTGSELVKSSHNITIKADMILTDKGLPPADAIVIPGGNPGYVNLREDKRITDIVREYYNEGKLVCAICGGPTVLKASGVAKDKKITSHTGVREWLSDYNVTGNPVEVDGNVVTSVGMATSVDFGLAIAGLLTDADTIAKAKKAIEYK